MSQDKASFKPMALSFRAHVKIKEQQNINDLPVKTKESFFPGTESVPKMLKMILERFLSVQAVRKTDRKHKAKKYVPYSVG